ncbi:acyl-CoA-like ligand-binding transcription factor [Streptomyces sp. 2A115]|uniref:acyl-CoA-like ligand-binding transcription factor n=1 Tax=Streptomyces sp. 2A115 TaxID=3457439 RepID=UPI003FD1D93E
MVLVGLEDSGRLIAEALAARPDEERPWAALLRAFDALLRQNEESPEQTLRYVRMLQETPSLRARHHEKQLQWRELRVPEVARRLATSPDRPKDSGPSALGPAAIACLDVATAGWVACDGAVPVDVLLDRAMGALAE